MCSINISRKAFHQERKVYFTGLSKQVQKSIKSFSDQKKKFAIQNINNYGVARPKRKYVELVMFMSLSTKTKVDRDPLWHEYQLEFWRDWTENGKGSRGENRDMYYHRVTTMTYYQKWIFIINYDKAFLNM